ncbi:initiation factor 2 subunit family protein [Stachybotrys elegans]|uniref:Translation initiation factor eIF2B subunit alpha n=1 Tax=Stachybotrys elegans TaxID=80388 RepID=A0A8K0T0Z6_9HYPO|nr:initiation factor 2 subunit family protein [Stachybotrys elegans]
MTTDNAAAPATAPAPAPAAGGAAEPAANSIGGFDIVAKYRSILAASPELTKPVAGIEALIALLESIQSSTIMETLKIIRQQAKHLIASVENPRPLEAGTDLFIHTVLAALKEDGAGSFDAIRERLLKSGRSFADGTIAARNRIAAKCWRVVTPGSCILTHGASRAVTTLLLRAAAERGPGTFKVVYVWEPLRAEECRRVVSTLEGAGIPVAVIGFMAVANVLAKRRPVNKIIVGAEVITQNHGILSRMGTYLLAREAKVNRPQIPFHVAVETHKFSRGIVWDQSHLGFHQDVLDFGAGGQGMTAGSEDAVDWTDATHITSLLTEDGEKHLGYVTEELIRIYNNLLPIKDDYLDM